MGISVIRKETGDALEGNDDRVFTDRIHPPGNSLAVHSNGKLSEVMRATRLKSKPRSYVYRLSIS